MLSDDGAFGDAFGRVAIVTPGVKPGIVLFGAIVVVVVVVVDVVVVVWFSGDTGTLFGTVALGGG